MGFSFRRFVMAVLATCPVSGIAGVVAQATWDAEWIDASYSGFELSYQLASTYKGSSIGEHVLIAPWLPNAAKNASQAYAWKFTSEADVSYIVSGISNEIDGDMWFLGYPRFISVIRDNCVIGVVPCVYGYMRPNDSINSTFNAKANMVNEIDVWLDPVRIYNNKYMRSGGISFIQATSTVPEPSGISCILSGLGFAGLMHLFRKHQQSRAA